MIQINIQFLGKRNEVNKITTREENLKKINAELELITDEELEQVAGGSMWFEEAVAKKCGISLKKEDGSPGEFTWYYNYGDYYWNDQKITTSEAHAIAFFVSGNGYQPKSVEQAVMYKLKNSNRDF